MILFLKIVNDNKSFFCVYFREVEYIKIDENCHSSNCTYVRLIEDEAEAVDDATAGMIIVILLFILPSQLHFWPFVSGDKTQ